MVNNGIPLFALGEIMVLPAQCVDIVVVLPLQQYPFFIFKKLFLKLDRCFTTLQDSVFVFS